MSVGGGKAVRTLIGALMALALALVGAEPIRAAEIDYDYDVHGRLVGVRYPDNMVLYTYDVAGNRTRRLAESCVEYGPTAVTDAMTIYVGYVVEEYGNFWYAYGSLDATANDTDPGSYDLTITELSTGWLYVDSNIIIMEAFSTEGSPPSFTSFTYTISNGHCHTAVGTVNVSYVYE